nr:MAG TPA: hypothetical protein [Caudoviricetes sp.]
MELKSFPILQTLERILIPSIPLLVLPLKPILNVKNITYFKYYIAYLYYFRFIFVSLQQILYNIIYVRYV